MAAKKNQNAELDGEQDNGDGEKKEKNNWTIVATLLKRASVVDEYEKVAGMTFRPTGNGADPAEAMLAALKKYGGEQAEIVDVDVTHILVSIDEDAGLFLWIAWRRSSSNCPTCAAVREDPTDWCHDLDGCEQFRNPGKLIGKRGIIDTEAILAKLNSAAKK